jgi:acyl-CoA synthetase (AMP-forming)/AMP-acid ligase II
MTLDAIRTLNDITRINAATAPDALAMVFDGRETTYGELDRRACKIANGLRADGCADQARIAILDKNSDLFFELMFGAIKAGAVLVPVNWRLAAPEISAIVNDAKAEILFVGPLYFDVVDKIRADLKTVRKVVALSGSHPGWEVFAAWRDRQVDQDPMRPTATDDVAIQLYTSGTTGLPKGVMLTHANFLALLPTALEMWGGWTSREVVIVTMPLFHIAGSGWAIVAFYVGAVSVILPEVDPTRILDVIERRRITQALFVPAVILMLVQHPQCGMTDFSSLKNVVYGAAPIPTELLIQAMKALGCGFIQVYGLTETTGAFTWLAASEHVPGSKPLLSCGKAFPGVELRVVEADGRDCKVGQVGEIVCRTPQVMLGYAGKPEETAKAIRSGWFHTGDAGYLDADGYLYIHDRVKDMIVSGGENVYPAEVESAIFGHPALSDVAVIGVPDDKWGEAVKAIVVLKPGAKATEAEIIAYARERIAGYKLPKSVDIHLGPLPRNPSGKLLKRVLRAPYWEGRKRLVN